MYSSPDIVLEKENSISSYSPYIVLENKASILSHNSDILLGNEASILSHHSDIVLGNEAIIQVYNPDTGIIILYRGMKPYIYSIDIVWDNEACKQHL